MSKDPLITFARKHALVVEELTEKQFADVLQQMIRSGDVMRHVHKDMQSVSYVPFRKLQTLEIKTDDLEGMCAALKGILAYTDNPVRAKEMRYQAAREGFTLYDAREFNREIFVRKKVADGLGSPEDIEEVAGWDMDSSVRCCGSRWNRSRKTCALCDEEL